MYTFAWFQDEKQDLHLQLVNLQRVAGLKNDDIEKEVDGRIHVRSLNKVHIIIIQLVTSKLVKTGISKICADGK